MGNQTDCSQERGVLSCIYLFEPSHFVIVQKKKWVDVANPEDRSIIIKFFPKF